MSIWKVIGILYAVGTALVIRDKYRTTELMPDSIENQLDIAIHTTQMTEKYPWAVVSIDLGVTE